MIACPGVARYVGVVVLPGLLAVAGCGMPGCASSEPSIVVPSADDARQAYAVADALLDRYPELRNAASSPGEPAVFAASRGGPRGGTNHLTIYTVLDRSKQDAICEALRDILARLKAKPIEVEFRREGVLRTWTAADGGTVTARGEEEVLRTERIE